MERLFRIAVDSSIISDFQKSYSITIEEYQKLFPELSPSRLSFLFLKDYVLLLAEKTAIFLTEKYSSLMLVDENGKKIQIQEAYNFLKCS